MNNKKKFNSTKYTKHRRKLLKEVMKLMYSRDKLNASIRKVRKELGAWDNYLIREGDK